MALMPLTLSWLDIAVRLALATIAGALFGINRGESGKVAGLRTTLLVCIAACTAMLQVNALLAQAGKHSDSFAVLDLMRLPLGILSGVGFIGGGVILRKDGFVRGVTTAATLWIVTVVGLCFGGGQLALGMTTSVLGVVTLWFLKSVEERIPRHQTTFLTVEYDSDLLRDRLLEALRLAGCSAVAVSASVRTEPAGYEETLEVRWWGTRHIASQPRLLEIAIASGALTARYSNSR
ncbi:MgtC/SapB family protein (plasmid) [Paraburkholderia sp. D15]|uniref:MgtC/SapB family protein n=1 Tax=Paraburkholderia sp. D15 TaxID=2880218 RepID=UPI002479DD29|nr:MgtC/SapB family protein [Paraburkholderia sp. D15]WGS54990.1 MgtC/SapB family protein [Paraburkholderia sp. D15]